MNMKTFNVWLGAALMCFAACNAGAQEKGLEDFPVRLGDTAAQVQAKFGHKAEAGKDRAAMGGSIPELKVKSKGMRFFFDRAGKVSMIRLDAPFKGRIAGIRLGDTMRTLKAKLGEPARELADVAPLKAYIYRPDSGYTARFDLKPEGGVETIFVFK